MQYAETMARRLNRSRKVHRSCGAKQTEHGESDRYAKAHCWTQVEAMKTIGKPNSNIKEVYHANGKMGRTHETEKIIS